jgi:hypothetical protein
MKQTAVEWLVEQLTEVERKNWINKKILLIGKNTLAKQTFDRIIEQAKEMEKQRMIELVQSLKDYTYESHTILGHDEREASEFVETFIDVFLLKNHLKQQEQ